MTKDEQIKQLEEQIEQLKCCGNCDNWVRLHEKCFISSDISYGEDYCNFWEQRK